MSGGPDAVPCSAGGGIPVKVDHGRPLRVTVSRHTIISARASFPDARVVEHSPECVVEDTLRKRTVGKSNFPARLNRPLVHVPRQDLPSSQYGAILRRQVEGEDLARCESDEFWAREVGSEGDPDRVQVDQGALDRLGDEGQQEGHIGDCRAGSSEVSAILRRIRKRTCREGGRQPETHRVRPASSGSASAKSRRASRGYSLPISNHNTGPYGGTIV